MSRFALPSHTRSLFVLSLVLAVGTALSSGSVRVQHVPEGPSYLFLSPNTDDHLSLAEVSRRLASPVQKQYRLLAGDIVRQLGVADVQVHDSVGDWGDGVENSLLVVLPAAEPQTLRCAAAWFGLIAQQKAVLAFRPDPAGTDVLMILDLPQHNLDAARQLLDRHGVRDRTLMAHAHGCRVFVLTTNGSVADALRQAAHDADGRLHCRPGWAESLAGPTQLLARQRYTEVIRAYRTARPKRPLARLR
jgi:hypothetical protein